MGRSRISYLTDTWNPITGCTPVGPGCRNCWAQEVLTRFSTIHDSEDPGTIREHEDRMDEPLRWRRPRVVGVCFLSDLFHESVATETINRIFQVMTKASAHTFLVLTKRPARMYMINPITPPNVVLGVSAWDHASTDTGLRFLMQTGDLSTKRLLSLEPLLGPVDLAGLLSQYNNTLDGVILGGESGREQAVTDLDPQWVRDVRYACTKRGIPFYFKQWSGARSSERPCLLDGVEYHDLPECMHRPS